MCIGGGGGVELGLCSVNSPLLIHRCEFTLANSQMCTIRVLIKWK